MRKVIFTEHKDKEYGCLKFHPLSNEYVPEHTHDCYEIIIVSNGKYSHFLNGKEKIMERYECCLIRPNDSHSFRQLSKDTYNYLIMIKKECYEEFCKFMSSDFSRNLADMKSCYFTISNERMKKIVSILNTIRKQHEDNQDCTLYRNLLLFNLCEPLIRIIPSISLANHPKWLEDILFEINSLENADWKVADVVKHSFYSHTHLERVFKEEMGMPLVLYLAKVKMIHARDLLINTDKPLIEISTMLGYSSLSHFHKVFKEEFGFTPNYYRNQNSDID